MGARTLLIERTKEVLAHARSQGRYSARSAALTSEQKKAVRSALNDGTSTNAVAKSLVSESVSWYFNPFLTVNFRYQLKNHLSYYHRNL